MLTSALPGFAASVVLIVAIGAQNAFVLRQGLRREHVLPVVVTCAVSDLVLIAAGIAGLGAVVSARPTAVTVIRWVGAYDLSVGRNVNEVLRTLDALQTDELCPCNWQKGEDTIKVA